MGASQILILAASIADKLLGMMPNYSQKKIEDMHKARMRYLNEINKEILERDDNLISTYHDELFYILQDFDKEIQ